jgi:N-acetylmuramoyl-L-alanine amidase
LVALTQAFSSDLPLEGRTILLDPGHGVLSFKGDIVNSGQKSRDKKILERKINFEVCQKLASYLTKEGANVVLTRPTNQYWRQAYTATEDNKNRALLANEIKADIFVSLHCDWHPKSAINGVTTFYETSESRPLGAAIHRRLIDQLKCKNRQLVKDHYTVLDFTSMPAVLVEMGFLSNKSESKKLAQSNYQDRIAKSIGDGIKAFFLN